MRRIPWLLLPVTGALLCLSGCLFGNVEEMLSPPAPPALYQSLQTKLLGEQGNGEAIAPLGGENRQSVQLVDLDGDERQEAVAFFRDETAASPLRISIFRQNRDGDYHLLTRLEGAGSDIQSVDYVDLVGDPCRELLVSWQASSAVHTLAAYRISGGETAALLRESCDGFVTGDLTGDGRAEVLLLKKGGDGQPWRVLCQTESGDGMKESGQAALSQGAGESPSWVWGTLADGKPAVFVTSRLGAVTRITDVLCFDGSGLRNLALSGDSGQSDARCPDYAGVFPCDMTGDGVTDVPVVTEIPGYGESEGQVFHWLSWRQYRSDGTGDVVLRTCCGTQGEWFLRLPASWTGEFSQSLSRKKGEERLSIARKGEDKPFLTITRLSGEDRGERSREKGQVLLYAEADFLYTAQLFPEVWDCGLDREGLVERFSMGTRGQ